MRFVITWLWFVLLDGMDSRKMLFLLADLTCTMTPVAHFYCCRLNIITSWWLSVLRHVSNSWNLRQQGHGGWGGCVQVLRNGGREWVAGESGSPSDFQWWSKFYVARGGWVAVIHLFESQTSDLYKTSCIKSASIRLTHPNMFDKRWYKRHFKTSCSCICVRTPEPCWFIFFLI